jgi:16S rRNA C967 or C1407 C5-methylase (RsmB/RsmF family)/NOL1/NOP2/fmu family ribosome biogenesis protein
MAHQPLLPKPFVAQMQSLLGTEWPAFETALSQPPPVSIRLNPAKTPNNPALLPDFDGQVAWHPDGRYLPERPSFTLDPVHHAGAYYVQEASSMLIFEAIRQTVGFDRSLKCLDLCAAPGGKTTLLASLPLTGKIRLVANEVIRARTAILRENVERWGAPNNPIVTSMDADELATRLPAYFDVVVCDAPCSGEGMFRKDADAIGEWSPDHVNLCAARQKRIIAAAAALVAPDGLLLYSTCTYNRAENEENVAWICAEFGFEPCELTLGADWGITQTDGGYRLMPHRARGEGFFMAPLRKKGGEAAPKVVLPVAFQHLTPVHKKQLSLFDNWVDQAQEHRFFQTKTGEILSWHGSDEPDLLFFDKMLKFKWFGTQIGTIKGNDLIPDHALAMHPTVAKQDIQKIELTREQALIFLKKETFDLPFGTPLGWTLACYGGLALGWLKVLPNRMNNYLPSERRIRMDV